MQEFFHHSFSIPVGALHSQVAAAIPSLQTLPDVRWETTGANSYSVILSASCDTLCPFCQSSGGLELGSVVTMALDAATSELIIRHPILSASHRWHLSDDEVIQTLEEDYAARKFTLEALLDEKRKAAQRFSNIKEKHFSLVGVNQKVVFTLFLNRLQQFLPQPGGDATDSAKATDTTRAKKRGPNTATYDNIRRVARYREAMLLQENQLLGKTHVCETLGISSTTVRKYALKLYTNWDDPNYHWSDEDLTD